jgi:hypothetical protein
MSKITESAKGEDCTVCIPGVCNHNPETTVLAHINGIRFGHGIASKVKWDGLGAYCCSACHDVIDGRVKSFFDKQELKIIHYEAVFETQLKLIEKGLL